MGNGRRTVGVAKPGGSHPFARNAKGWGSLIVGKVNNQKDLWCATRRKDGPPGCYRINYLQGFENMGGGGGGVLIKSLRGTGGRLRRFLGIPPLLPRLLLISMHERKVILRTAKSRSEVPGQLRKRRQTVGVAKPGLPPFRQERERRGTRRGRPPRFPKARNRGHPQSGLGASPRQGPPAGIDGKSTTNHNRCRVRAKPDCQGLCYPRCPKARHLGHPSSVVVLTSPGTWATRPRVSQNRDVGNPPHLFRNAPASAAAATTSGVPITSETRVESSFKSVT